MHPPSTCLAQREGASGHSRARPQPPDAQAQSRQSHTDHVLQAPRVTELPHPGWIFTFGAGSLLPRARFSQVCFFQATCCSSDSIFHSGHAPSLLNMLWWFPQAMDESTSSSTWNLRFSMTWLLLTSNPPFPSPHPLNFILQKDYSSAYTQFFHLCFPTR